jgi:amidase
LGALTGVDKQDTATLSSVGYSFTDYTQFLDADYLQHARIGVPRTYFQDLDEARLAIVETAIGILKDKGATIIDPITLPCEQTEWDGNVLLYEFKKGLDEYLSNLPSNVPVHALKEVIEYNDKHADIALKYGQSTLIASEETSGTLTEQEYLESLAMNKEMAGEQGIDYALKEHQLDALLFLGDEGGNDIAARAGYPSITVPGGFAESGVTAPGGYTTKGPQGITFVGTAFSEPTLLKLAYSFEQATKHRFPPEIKE